MKVWQSFILFTIMVIGFANAQTTTPPPDYIFAPHIKFAEIHKKGATRSVPIIELNSSEKLHISFDDLQQGLKSYSYSIIHCNTDWTPSDLLFMQYMDGFESYEIFDFILASNTTVQYTHYWFEFPNEYMKPTRSGNYMLKVFPTGKPDEPIFTRRFMVFENKVPIQATVRNASLVDLRSTHQEICLFLKTNSLLIGDMYNDLQVVVTQNNRWDNANYTVKPRYISSGNVDYCFATGELTFPNGNQYRPLDLKSFNYWLDPVVRIQLVNGKYQVVLRPTPRRSNTNFIFYEDINGQYVVYNQDTYDTKISPDYLTVNFELATDEIPGGQVYLIGAFTMGEVLPAFKMGYNPTVGAYQLSVPLKQGYYNYMYGFVKDGSSVADVGFIEGNFMDTDNDYAIYVYARESGDIAPRLVGVSFINSWKNR